MPLTNPFDSVLMIGFGGPNGPADVRPFLENVVRGRRVPPARLDEVAAHYRLFDGVSPLTALMQRQAEGLRTRLEREGPALPVHLGMRNWHPFLSDAIEAMARQGLRRAIGVIAAPHRSYASCGQYRENVLEARRELARRGQADVEVFHVGDWHEHEGFITANANRVESALERLPSALRAQARLLFTAHSLPIRMPGTDTYQAQIRQSAARIAAGLGRRDWTVVYQSRSGRPEDPWLEPDIGAYLERERAAGLAAVVVVPVGFLCDHIEVLYDLDHEAAAICERVHLPYVRAHTVNDHPAFLDMLASVVRRTFDRYAGSRPLSIVAPT